MKRLTNQQVTMIWGKLIIFICLYWYLPILCYTNKDDQGN